MVLGSPDENPPAEAAPSTGLAYTIFGPRGGSGKTTLAVNLAVSLARAHPGQVCLVDLALTFGHCAMTLDIPPKASLASTSADTMTKIDTAGLDHFLAEHSSTLKLLVGARMPEEGDRVTAAHVTALISMLKRAFPLVIVDTESHFSDPTIAALEVADKIMMLCTLELATLRDLSECKRIFSKVINIPNERCYYVLNNPFPFKPLGIEQFVQNLEQSIDAEVPYGNDIPAKAAVSGQAFVQSQSGSAIAKAIEKLAKTIEAEAFPQQQQERRGLFSRR
jgi:pilus assembly protein CpaE